MTLWLLLNSVAVVILMAIQYVVLRQIGVMLVRLGPRRAACVARAPCGRESDVFGLPNCTRGGSGSPRCMSLPRRLVQYARRFEKRRGLWCLLERPCGHRFRVRRGYPKASKRGVLNVRFWSDNGLSESMNIRMIPFGVMTDDRGVVVASGLINTAGNMELLLEKGAKRSQETEKEESHPALAGQQKETNHE